VVEKSEIRPRADLAAGDVILGLPSAGLHSNGHSLARKVVLETLKLPLDARPKELGGSTVAEEMLRPTIIYADAFRALKAMPWKAAAHITGGGLIENPPRIFSGDSLDVSLDYSTWDVPGIFKLIASAGVEEAEMRRTFNMGIGMIIVVAPELADAACAAIPKARPIGKLVRRA
jgi:phosphoribosylformylglycinamidine cyclo-ligase